MSSDLAVFVISSLINIFISLLVVFRNYRQLANRAFALTSFCLICWSGLNLLSSHISSDYTLVVTRVTGFFGILLITSFFTLSTVFPTSFKFSRRTVISFLTLYFAMSALSLTSLSLASVDKTASGIKLHPGVLYPLYSLYILVLFILCNVNYVRHYRHATRIQKSQIKFMWLALIVTFVLIVLSNIIVPAINSKWSASHYGTLFTVPFVAITAYAILKGRIFDVRLVITRTIAYILTIGVVAALYSGMIIFAATQFSSFKELTTAQLCILVLPALFVALTFHRIQVVIDRITTRIFYQDAYDVREVLDQLSDTLLAEKDIDKIMAESLMVITSALKPSGAYFAVLNNSGVVYKQLQMGRQQVNDLAPFMLQLRKERLSLIDREELPTRAISKLMAKQDVELLLRLGDREAPIGVLLLGAKRNGSMYTKQDISLLRISAKNLSIALDNAKKYEQIIHFADTLHKEVTRATSRLRKANQELKTLDALKDDFISTASHQLRSPAVSVHDALHMLNYPNVSKKDRDDLLILAEGSSERLVTVVRTLLNMARIQAGHFTIDTTEIDLIDLVNRELEQVKVLADQKSITIKFIKPEHALMASVDVAKLTEAVANYVENAIKYSLENTTIELTLKQEGKKARFEVADQGMGVPLKERKDLFGRFYRASNARQEQPDGNGIGLYVVKNIAEGHGGEAYYRPGDSSGSVFGFWIKLDAKH